MHLDIFSRKKNGTLAMKNQNVLHRLDARSVQFAWLGPDFSWEKKNVIGLSLRYMIAVQTKVPEPKL